MRWEYASLGFADANEEALRRQVEEMRRMTDRGRIEEAVEKVFAVEATVADVDGSNEDKSIPDSERPL